METNFFASNSYFIDEKVGFFKFENSYQIYNEKGEDIGSIKQGLTLGQKILRVLFKKSSLPFLLEIRDSADVLEASISRGWTFFMSKITIKDAQGNPVGTIKQQFTLVKPVFRIFNSSEMLIATITGNWQAWDFKIKDANDNQIGTISKKWAGVAKEFFTTADKYHVAIEEEYANYENKMVILSGAITIDMLLKESK